MLNGVTFQFATIMENAIGDSLKNGGYTYITHRRALDTCYRLMLIEINLKFDGHYTSDILNLDALWHHPKQQILLLWKSFLLFYLNYPHSGHGILQVNQAMESGLVPVQEYIKQHVMPVLMAKRTAFWCKFECHREKRTGFMQRTASATAWNKRASLQESSEAIVANDLTAIH